jgi:hypothetical protein
MKKIYLLLSLCLLNLFTDAQTIPSYVPTNGLVGWWPFNGNANDESGNGNNGTVNGATLTTDRNGNVNSAYYFDGVNDFIQISNNPSLEPSNSITIAAWVFIETNPSDNFPAIISKEAGIYPGYVSYALICGNAGYNQLGDPGMLVTTNTVGYHWTGVTGASLLNQWVFVTGVYNGSYMNIYHNGNLATSIPVSGTIQYQNYLLTIARSMANSTSVFSYFNGKIDDIAIFNRALTQQEITALYQATPPCSLSISSQPTNQSTYTGSNTSFNVGVTATNCNSTSYQWQTNTGFGWQTLQNAGQYTGVNTSTLNVSNVNLANTNQLFRCIINAGNLTDTTQTATLTVVNTNNTNLSGVTHAIPYQAVVRDGSGTPLVNHPITVRFTLHDSSASGSIIYQETHNITTNNLGLFTLHIGTGTASIGNIDSIHWALYKKYLQVEFDTTAQGGNYIDLGTQQFMAVPYALYAETAGNALNGPKGDKGDAGVNGMNGVDGSNGTNGQNGADGISVTSATITNDSLYLSLSNTQTINAGKLSSGLPNGTAVGEMMYWNGSAWVSVSPTTSLPGNQAKTLKFCNGVPTWNDCPAVLPTLTTDSVSNIAEIAAILYGNILNDGGAAILQSGFCLSTSPNPTITNNTQYTIGATSTGSIAYGLWNLLPSQTYYFRTYATNSSGTNYGNEITFNTLTPALPTISTIAINNIGPNSINSGVNIISNSNVPILDAGICWSTSSNPTISSSSHSSLGSLQIGTYNIHINGLIPNTTYHIRSYATNITGTNYGNEITFTTLNSLSVGMSYQGGIISYILGPGNTGYDPNETHGLIAAPFDQSSGAQWGCYGTIINGADGIDIGTGLQNTIDIMSGCGGYAAAVCFYLNLNGYDDWYLPSLNELATLNAISGIGGLGGYYWSSSEYLYNPSIIANSFCFPISISNGWKHDMLKVRAIRSF